VSLSVATAGGSAFGSPEAEPRCHDPLAVLTGDHAYVVGSAAFADPDGDLESHSAYRWLAGTEPLEEGQVLELLSLPLDEAVDGRNTERPLTAEGLAYRPGVWGSALALTQEGRLAFARQGNLDLNKGTIEMWVALRSDGGDPRYSERSHVLFQYRDPGGDYISVAQSGRSGIIYAGGETAGNWQSAYGWRASTRAWKAGEWHHLAYTFSGSGNFMRFYVDGVLTADSNEKRYVPPTAGGETIHVGGGAGGPPADYLIDELRISGRVAPADEIAARARRLEAPLANEVWLPTERLGVGDEVTFEFTPAAAGESGATCRSEPLAYPGIPIIDPDPPSTLLPPHTTAFDLAVRSTSETTCAYALGAALPFDEMSPFTHGAGTTVHTTTVRGLHPEPNVVNDVFVRCAAHPRFVLHLRYRSLSPATPTFPRTGNLWGSSGFASKGLEYASRIDLWLGANFSPNEIRRLRRMNPAIRILTSINAIENKGLPEDYYLRDVNGKRIEVWPNSYRLNLTKPYVAEHQARYAYQRILDSDLMFDGCFFDNVMTTQSWLRHDIYGNPVAIDADEDGVADDPEALDAAWKAGVLAEIRLFRELMPHAIVSGHAMNIAEPGIAELFNGTSIGFWTTDVIEGKRSFDDLWDRYQAWLERVPPPPVTMIESSPPDQISYGYDYRPLEKIPPTTLEFARTYYPYVRFGLAFTLLGDGYFAHEFGDTWHGNDWWYDELDFDLGRPLGPAARIDVGEGPGPNIIENGSFEDDLGATWRLSVNTAQGCAARVARDTSDAAVGAVSARVEITATSGTDWHINLAQLDRQLVGGEIYELAFWAKADAPRAIRVSAQKNGPDWRGYGLSRRVAIERAWREYRVAFTATESANDARIQFFLGATTGTVWLDDVRLFTRGPDVYRRDYDNGVAILNASTETQHVHVGQGYQRLTGNQAPRHETIIDDGDEAFSTTGRWQEQHYDSGEWKATGPFFHDWGPGCQELQDESGEARWALPISASDTYTITAWWAAVPPPPERADRAVYEVVAGGQVVSRAVLDQRSGGDEWHVVAEVPLKPADEAFVRLRCNGRRPCIADALHLRSASRYNDGAPASDVELAPMDGIVLRRIEGYSVFIPRLAVRE